MINDLFHLIANESCRKLSSVRESTVCNFFFADAKLGTNGQGLKADIEYFSPLTARGWEFAWTLEDCLLSMVHSLEAGH